MSDPTKFDELRERVFASGIAAAATDSISGVLSTQDLATIEAEVEARAGDLLDALLIRRDHNTADTPRRLAKMFVREVFAGRYQPAPPVTDFPNARELSGLYVVGPVAIRSTCSHHFCPILGEAWIGVVAGDRVIGLSKFARLADWVMSRPQIQEEATVQLADEIEARVNPRGLAVLVRARHACMSWRGVRDAGAAMTTVETRGLLRDDGRLRDEFLREAGRTGFACS